MQSSLQQIKVRKARQISCVFSGPGDVESAILILFVRSQDPKLDRHPYSRAAGRVGIHFCLGKELHPPISPVQYGHHPNPISVSSHNHHYYSWTACALFLMET